MDDDQKPSKQAHSYQEPTLEREDRIDAGRPVDGSPAVAQIPSSAIFMGYVFLVAGVVLTPYAIWQREIRFPYRGDDYAFTMNGEPMQFWACIAFLVICGVLGAAGLKGIAARRRGTYWP